jgi:TolB-like protein/Tfp pilus assembly protein PilF
MGDATNKAVFLSYASQDADAARRICDALRAVSVEVWFDQSELRGGDAWDAKIRKQIKECALFVPVISANTQARPEGYFRLEWRLADQRSHLMSRDHPFILPIALDDTRDAGARVPDSFLEVQWTRLPGGAAPDAFCERVKMLLGGVPPEGERAGTTEAISTPLTPLRKTRRISIATGLGLVGLVVGISAWITVRPSAPAGNAPVSSRAKDATASVAGSEVQQLLAKIATIVEKDADATRPEWALAETIGAQAVKLEPGNADAWAAYAQAALGLNEFYLDRARSPLSDALERAQHALSLAPNSDEAKLALARCYWFRRGTGDEAETILRELLLRHPDDRRVLRALASVMRTKGSLRDVDSAEARNNLEEAVAFYTRAAELPGSDPAAWREMSAVLTDLGRYPEAESALERSLALRRGPAALVRKIWFLLLVRHDVPGACALVESLPGSYFLREDVVESAALAWLWRGDAARCLRVVIGWNDEFLATVPKGFLVGQAQHLLQRPEAARLAWRDALVAVERQLADPSISNSNKVTFWLWKARLEALLGDKTAAAENLRLYEQSAAPTSRRLTHAATLVALERFDAAIDVLAEAGGAARTRSDGRNFALDRRASLRFDPVWNPLRGNPRFEVLLAGIKSPIEMASFSTGGQAAEKSIAVLAFRQLSADPENEYLCEAISDELCSVLGRVPGLKVAASASAFSFKGKRVRPSEMAAQLGVAYLVDGRVQKNGSRVRVGAELIKASDESVVWKSDPLDLEAKDMFAVQDTVVAAIAKNLHLRFRGQATASLTINPEAFRLYSEGRRIWKQRGGATDVLAPAQQLFQQAVDLDPQLGRAYAGLAEVALVRDPTLTRFGNRDSAQMREILALSEQAIAHEPDSAEVHATRGRALWEAWRIAEADQELRAAIRLNPSYADAHASLAHLLVADGRMSEGLAEYRLAAELDPLTGANFVSYARTLSRAGRHAEALAQLDVALTLISRGYILRTKMAVLTAMGRTAEALALARHPEEREWASEGKVVAFAAAGQMQEAEEALAKLDAAWNVRAPALLAVGRPAAALAELSAEKISILGVDAIFYLPALDPIRADPRFVAVLATTGLKEAHDRAQAWRKAHPPEKPEAKK